MSAQILRMNLVENLGKTKAFFTVAIEGFEIADMKLIEGKNGLFVGVPSRSYKAKDGTTKYNDIVKITSKAFYNQIVEAAKAEYERREGSTTAKTASNVSLDDDDTDEELPF